MVSPVNSSMSLFLGAATVLSNYYVVPKLANNKGALWVSGILVSVPMRSS